MGTLKDTLDALTRQLKPETPNPINRCPSHTEKVFDIRTLPLVAKWGEEMLLRSRVDAIVVSGHSGLVLAGALSFLTRLPVFAVRKANEGAPRASSNKVSGIAPNGPVRRWAWVDDLISSGGTMRYACLTAYREGLVTTPIPAAVLLYESYGKREERVAVKDTYQYRSWEEACDHAGYTLPDDAGWTRFSYRTED